MHNDIRILLVNAINPTVEVEGRYPNLGLGHLAASVQKHLPHEKITFLIVDHNIRETLKNFRPHLVGISSVSQNYNIALQYADFFTQQNIPVIFGGIHITALPQTLPKTAVAGCLGEAELTFVDLVKLFLHEALIPERLKELPGIIFWKGDTLVKTEPQPPRPGRTECSASTNPDIGFFIYNNRYGLQRSKKGSREQAAGGRGAAGSRHQAAVFVPCRLVPQCPMPPYCLLPTARCPSLRRLP